VAAQSAAVILCVRILTGQQCSYLLLKVEGMHRKGRVSPASVWQRG